MRLTRFLALALAISALAADATSGQSPAKPKKLFPGVPPGASVVIVAANDSASTQEAHRFVREQGWIASPSAGQYAVVVFKSDRANPLTRYSYNTVREIQQDIWERSSVGEQRFHCYVFEFVEPQPMAPPNAGPTLEKVGHESWGVPNPSDTPKR